MKEHWDLPRKCFLCGKTETDYNHLEKHHIFQGANRALSEKYGIIVLLCADCHRGDYSAHQSGEVAQFLHEYGQRKAMQEQGWTVDEFREIFGRSYIND